MPEAKTPQPSVRPERFEPSPLPDAPAIDDGHPDQASVAYSSFRTSLSRHRTGLSEHRTDLSEYRSDLSSLRTELSMRRTGMSIQRTRMSADRTLMSEIRTSLSMIGFGFTLYETFRRLAEAGTIQNGAAPRNFGLLLILLGMLILVGGIWRHVQFAQDLRRRRQEMVNDKLIHGDSGYPLSITLVVALGLLLVGLFAVLNIVFDLSLFG